MKNLSLAFVLVLAALAATSCAPFAVVVDPGIRIGYPTYEHRHGGYRYPVDTTVKVANGSGYRVEIYDDDANLIANIYAGSPPIPVRLRAGARTKEYSLIAYAFVGNEFVGMTSRMFPIAAFADEKAPIWELHDSYFRRR